MIGLRPCRKTPLEASRLLRRRAFGLPVMLAVTVLAYVVVSVARGEGVAFGGLSGLWLVLFVFGGLSAAFWYLTRPEIGSTLLSPIALLPRADQKAVFSRIRRGEAGDTPEEARLQLTVAERLSRSQLALGLGGLVIGLQHLPDAITGDGRGGRWLSAPMAIGFLALAALSARNRSHAQRAIEANRRRWGAI